MNDDHRGFTLMELLIVVAIIAVLVAIAIPMFTSQLDKSRRAADMANARSAYAAATIAYMSDYAGEDGTYVFDPASGKALPQSEAGSITPYGKWDSEADYEVAGVPVSGNAASGGYVCVTFSGGVVSSVFWGSGTGSLYRSMLTIRDFGESLTGYDESVRLAADRDGLQMLADSYVGMTYSEIVSMYGVNAAKGFGYNGARLMAYYTNANADGTTKSCRVTGYVQDVLERMGSTSTIINTYEQGGQTRYNLDTRNFYSTYMNSNAGQDRNIMLHLTYSKGRFNTDPDNVVTGVEIWVQNQGGDTTPVPEELSTRVVSGG